MGAYSDYLGKGMDFTAMVSERKRLLAEISRLRGGRDILVFASDINKPQAPISIDFTDILAFQDQLSNLGGDAIDILLETPGGFAEVVEDLVKLVRSKYKKVGIIIPGFAKSAGTIFAMAGDEILMGEASALGPIDAQIIHNGKRFSAEAFLEGLNKMKAEALQEGLNRAYIPILQNISPGEIQHCENAQKFSKILVTRWLAEYKFSPWENHSSTGKPVTPAEKTERANEIAEALCKHSDWLTHGRSIKIDDFARLKLLITNYEKNPALNEAILKYYAVLRMTFESTGMYKLFETMNSQVMRFVAPVVAQPQHIGPGINQNPGSQKAVIDFQCGNCKSQYKIQANLEPNLPLEKGCISYPVGNNIFVCLKCKNASSLLAARLQIEAQTGKHIVN